MKSKSNIIKEFSAVIIAVLLICPFFIFSFSMNIFEVHAQVEYEYYGYVPARMYQYNLTIGSDPNSGWRLDTNSTGTAGFTTAGLVAVVGISDNTHVEVYNLGNGSLVSQITINSLQKYYAVFRNGSFFKVVTDKLANVYLLNYGSIPAWNATSLSLPDSYYQDVNGAYVGKEFVLLGTGSDYDIDIAVFALENAQVTVTRNDSVQTEYTFGVNEFTSSKNTIGTDPFRTYRVESTGYIMIQSGRPVDIWGEARSFFVPSAEGGFVGTTFYSWSQPNWDGGERYGFRASSTQDTTVTVFNLETTQVLMTLIAPANSGVSFQASANAIAVQADKPITLEYLHNGSIVNSLGHNGTYDAYGSGVAFIGVKPYEATPFYMPEDSNVEAYIFASEDTDITLDGFDWFIPAGTYYSVSSPGTHILTTNKNVVIETLNWPGTPPYQGLVYNGAQIPSVQTVDVSVDVTLTPLGTSFPIIYIFAGAAAASVAAIIAFIFIRGRGKK
jgi:hypothetical protein